MNIITTELEGVYIIERNVFTDKRHSYHKTYDGYTLSIQSVCQSLNMDFDYNESSYVIANKNSFRGMHFQKKPCSQSKLIHVIQGSIIDIALNINRDSAYFGKYFAIELTGDNNKSLYMSTDYAHGFLSLTDKSIVSYQSTNMYNPKLESGVLYSSFGYDWGISDKDIIVSDKDLALQVLNKI